MGNRAHPPETHRELDLIGLGEVSLDRVLRVPRFPMRGEKGAVTAEHEEPGGQVATAVLGCARLGLRTAFVGAVGDDREADAALQPLRAAGVALRGIQQVPSGATRRAFILVEDETGERTVLERRHPTTRLDVAALEPDAIAGSRGLLVDTTDIAASVAASHIARSAGTLVFLDADDPSQTLDALLPLVDFAIVSQNFAEHLSGSGPIAAGLARLSAAGPAVAVATLGERGAIAVQGTRTVEARALRVEAVDTTGAGDAFRAGWIVATLAGDPLEGCLRVANAVAAISCTRAGAQGGLPTPEELERFLADVNPQGRAPRGGP
jgi:sugar/nucleoside kinase (ribokinase family)